MKEYMNASSDVEYQKREERIERKKEESKQTLYTCNSKKL